MVVIAPAVVETYKISPVLVVKPVFLKYPLTNIPLEGELPNAKANIPVDPDAKSASVAVHTCEEFK